MARTKASVGTKVASGKSSKARCSVAPSSSSNGTAGAGDKGPRNSSGGNPVCPRETPKWQKPITTFFICKETSRDSNDDENEPAGSSKPRPKRNVIDSDKSDDEVEKPKNKELDESIDLEPLTGENSHKIEEYYTEKGKGQGKKTRGKENKHNERQSLKRDRVEDETEMASKKVKVTEEIVV